MANNAAMSRIALILAAILFLAVVLILRYRHIGYIAEDWRFYVDQWTTLLRHEGFDVLGRRFSDYNFLYLYLLFLAVQLPISRFLAVKLTSVFFDAVLVLGVYKLLRLKQDLPCALLGALAIFVCPLFALNSSAWGQCDSIYVSCLVFCVYFLIKRNGLAAMSAFSVAFCLKLQSVFILPLFAVIYPGRDFRNYCGLKFSYILLPFLFNLIAGLPAMCAGRSFLDVLLFRTYIWQLSQPAPASLNAPTFFALFGEISSFSPGTALYNALPFLSLADIALLCLGLFIFYRNRLVLFTDSFLLITQSMALFSIFILPRMHERYFYFSEILAIAAAFWYRRFSLYLACFCIIVSSMISYDLYLRIFDTPYSLCQAAWVMLSGVALTFFSLFSYAREQLNKRMETSSPA